MHHIRGLKYIPKNKSTVDKILIAAKRKQLPLCRTHHLMAHKLGINMLMEITNPETNKLLNKSNKKDK